MDQGTLFALVLAAGESSRFGSPKQLASYRGDTLAGTAIRVAESVCGRRSVLVTGFEWERVVAACAPQQGFFVVNERFREGMSTSVRTGVAAIADVADAVLLMLADQPLVTAGHIDQLVDAWGGSADTIVASAFADTLGPPAIFPARYFDELCALDGDRGARPVIDSNVDHVVSVAIREAEADVDRPEDLENL
jgi:molybdenum cofactor cytidylyltransferase